MVVNIPIKKKMMVSNSTVQHDHMLIILENLTQQNGDIGYIVQQTHPL